jgi:hypothetical protein
MKNWKTKKADGKTFSTFRVNIGGHHVLVDCVRMKQAKDYVRKQFPEFIRNHGNNSFTIKRVK